MENLRQSYAIERGNYGKDQILSARFQHYSTAGRRELEKKKTAQGGTRKVNITKRSRNTPT